MTTEKTVEEIIYEKLKEETQNMSGKFVLLEELLSCAEAISIDMPTFLQSQQGQKIFCSVINRLVNEKLLKPSGPKPATRNGLYKKYRKIYAEKKDHAFTSEIIRSIEPPASVDYYIRNHDDFVTDKSVIKVISDFLKQKDADFVTVNERAYELFGDEKFFRSTDKNRSRGETVLKRLGLKYDDLRCYETPEPFFNFQRSDFSELKSRNVYIIENKDTFWSFKSIIMDLPSKLHPDMLIYGEGKKILSSFKFVEEYKINPENDLFIYFGDLDPEGINIFCALKDKYPQYRIEPFIDGYMTILEIGLKKHPCRTQGKQVINENNIRRFTEAFDKTTAEQIKGLLASGCYIPQEALSASLMKERFGTV